MKKYQIIYADPPWSYGGRKLNVSTKGKELEDHYSTMETDDICELPIKDLADKNCVLFIWVVYAKLEDAFKVINSWGFKYSTVAFEWIKLTTPWSLNPTQFMGANVVGGAIELCLMARKGSVKRIDKTIKRAIWDSRKRHSQKPEEARDRIVKLFGNIPRVELFARNRTEGWDVWGNEVKSDIDLITLKPK